MGGTNLEWSDAHWIETLSAGGSAAFHHLSAAFTVFRCSEQSDTCETFEITVLEQTRALRHEARRSDAYVLMPEHVHLLVNEPPRILLAQFLKAIKQITSRKLRGQRDKFWQARYYDSNIRGEEARSKVIRYIHRNPVEERDCVAKPEDWAMVQLSPPLRDRSP